MTNGLCVLVYAPLLLASLALFFSILTRDRARFTIRQYIVFSICLIAWLGCVMLHYVVRDAFWLRFLFDLKLVFVAFLAVSQFFMVVGFYRLERYFTGYRRVVFYVIPAITAVLALTSSWHPLLLQHFSVIEHTPLVLTDKARGFWFYIHTGYCYLLALGLSAIILVQHRKLPKAYRASSNILIACVALYWLGAILELTGLESSTLDMVLIGISLSNILFYLATVSAGEGNYLHIERKEIFNYLDEAIFILNRQGRIADVTEPARRWLQLVGRKLEYIPFAQLMDELVAEGTVARKKLEGDEGEDLYLLNSGDQLVYNMKRQTVARGDGVCVRLADVTRNRLLIERLRDVAGVDALTGLANRYRFSELLREIDRPASLPISVVMGDVNRLKAVNDSYGHAEGDLLLAAVASALASACPPGAVAARIGGDEFAMLLPGCGAVEVQAVIRQVQLRLDEVVGLRERPSIALGSATKQYANQNLNQIIDEADRKMYGDKQE